MKRLIIVIMALLTAVPVAARDNSSEDFVQIRAGTPVSLKADRAYIFYRVPQMKGVRPGDPVFYRERPDGFVDTTPNLSAARQDRWYAQTAAVLYYLIEVKPDSYIIAGLAPKGEPYMATCLCMGTLRFQARAGELTDLGYLLSDEVVSPSLIPELRAVTGRGARIADGTAPVLVAAIRQVGTDGPLPDALRGFPRTPAAFGPVGKHANEIARTINRMAPLAGVLGYDEDRVLDLRAGQ